jgi:hypothetical protein
MAGTGQFPGYGGSPYSGTGLGAGYAPAAGTLYGGYYADQPNSAYRRWLNAMGMGGGTDQRSQWYQQQAGDEFQNYEAHAPELGPNTSFLDFLSGQGPSIEQRWRQQQTQNDLNRSVHFTPKVRYQL